MAKATVALRYMIEMSILSRPNAQAAEKLLDDLVDRYAVDRRETLEPARRQPSRCWTMLPTDGKIMSGVDVATMMRSTLSAERLAAASASRAASSAMSLALTPSAAKWRARMPVRSETASWVYAAGGVTSTAADLNRFNQALLSNLFGFGYWAGKGYGFSDDGRIAYAEAQFDRIIFIEDVRSGHGVVLLLHAVSARVPRAALVRRHLGARHQLEHCLGALAEIAAHYPGRLEVIAGDAGRGPERVPRFECEQALVVEVRPHTLQQCRLVGVR